MNTYINGLLKTTDEDYVIAADTDSIYLRLEGIVSQVFGPNPTDTWKVIRFMDKVCEDKIQVLINKSYGHLAAYLNVYAQKMQMKREALCDKGIWTAKKRYIINVYNNEGVEYAKPKLKYVGLEMVKSSTPAACRSKLKEAVELIINKDEDTVINFIKTLRKQFTKMEPSEIAFPRGVNGIEKYTGTGHQLHAAKTPIHVRGSLVYNNAIRSKKLDKTYPLIKEGEKIKFIYLKEPNHAQSNIISFHNSLPKELDLTAYIDYNTQFEKSFLEPLKIILDSIKWKTERQNTLF